MSSSAALLCRHLGFQTASGASDGIVPPPSFPRKRESGVFGFGCFFGFSGNFQIVIPAQAGIQTLG
ncbi:hypothetical protein [Neisseria maigaei]|uniref:hypothetical protein n=1 Tax=Neisseria maigaei TaxID=2830651 RepID=UPI002659A578|nr:hypothetical protein [Neisseria maigaei]